MDEQTKHDLLMVAVPLGAAALSWVVRGVIRQRSVAVHDFRITVNGLHDKINKLRTEFDTHLAILKDREDRK